MIVQLSYDFRRAISSKAQVSGRQVAQLQVAPSQRCRKNSWSFCAKSLIDHVHDAGPRTRRIRGTPYFLTRRLLRHLALPQHFFLSSLHQANLEPFIINEVSFQTYAPWSLYKT